jgi:aspartate/methionine/tyrosine aminotransferase
MALKETVSEREKGLPQIKMGELLKIAVENKDIVSLGPGEPDFTPPKHVIDVAKKALDKGFTHYSPSAGRKEFLSAIVKKLKKENSISVKTNQVIATTGSIEAILMAILSATDPGESVLVPDPGFFSYIPLVTMTNGYPISYPLDFRTGFQIDTDKLNKLAKDKKTRTIIINSPSNPTGAVIRRNTLKEILEIANQNDLLIISDEAYEKFVYKGKHVSIGSLKGAKDRVLTLHSFSKSYGMAGFRIGYASGPEKIIKSMRNLHLHAMVCAPTISQIAATQALKGPQIEVQKNLKEYNRRRKYIVKRLNEIDGLTCNEPEGAFYAFAKIDSKINSYKLCDKLLKHKVAVVPGADFGRFGEGFIRLSFATSYKLIVEGKGQ